MNFNEETEEVYSSHGQWIAFVFLNNLIGADTKMCVTSLTHLPLLCLLEFNYWCNFQIIIIWIIFRQCECDRTIKSDSTAGSPGNKPRHILRSGDVPQHKHPRECWKGCAPGQVCSEVCESANKSLWQCHRERRTFQAI